MHLYLTLELDFERQRIVTSIVPWGSCSWWRTCL